MNFLNFVVGFRTMADAGMLEDTNQLLAPEEIAEEAEEEDEPLPKDQDPLPYPVVPAALWRDLDYPIPFSALVWDVLGNKGQARPFNPDILQKRISDFKACLPSSQLKIIVWPEDAFGMLLEKTRVSFNLN